MNRNVFSRSALDTLANKLTEVAYTVNLVGHTSVGSINAYTNAQDGVFAYVEATGQPTPVDSGATFGTLDSNAAPSTCGVLVMDGNFERYLDTTLPFNITSAQMTAGTITKAGASTTGLTASGNLAIVVSCTTLDLDSAIANHSFDLITRALRKLGA